MSAIIQIKDLSKTYKDGFQALKRINLDIEKGEIFALLGQNGAGKTTMISIICGIVRGTGGQVLVDGKDIRQHYRHTRGLIGLVPQELTTDVFATVISTLNFSRGLFGMGPDPAHLEKILKQLTLWDKRHAPLLTLSGGMKRRVLIAKALAHEPKILFLDEPTAGVDVELRKDMWALVETLRQSGVTIILTTHYIEEAEAIADRVGVIRQGQLIVVEDKDMLMARCGQKQMILTLKESLKQLPQALQDYDLTLCNEGVTLTYTYDKNAERTGITRLMRDLQEAKITFADLDTKQSSLEDIFVDLVKDPS